MILIVGCGEKVSEDNGHKSIKIEDKLIGEWVASSEARSVSLIFKKSRHAILVMDKKAIGGESFTQDDGTKAELLYEIDETKKPMSLDLVFYELSTKDEVGRFDGIFRFLTDKKIEYRMGLDGNRPIEFDFDDDMGTSILDKKMIEELLYTI